MATARAAAPAFDQILRQINALETLTRELERRVGELTAETRQATSTLDRALGVVEGRVRDLRDKEADRSSSERAAARTSILPPPLDDHGKGRD
jgi:hypothetical protein